MTLASSVFIVLYKEAKAIQQNTQSTTSLSSKLTMKPTLLLSLSFLPLFALLALSEDVEQVVDISGNPIFPGGTYYIMPSTWGAAGGGLKLGRTGNSNCPVTVLQDYSEIFRGTPVKFSIPGISPGIIFTGTHHHHMSLTRNCCI